MTRFAVLISYELNFYVARFFDKLFEVESVVAEGGRCFTLRIIPSFLKLRFVVDDAHAFSSAARCCFHNHRVLDVFGEANTFFHRRQQSV